MEAFALEGGCLRAGNSFAERQREAIPAADDTQPNARLLAMYRLCLEVMVEDLQNRRDLTGWPLPVRRGKREEREGVNPQVRGAANDASGGFCASTVTRGARETTRGCPAAVAVADDGHMETVIGGRGNFPKVLPGDRLHQHAHFSAAMPRNVLCNTKHKPKKIYLSRVARINASM